MQLNAQQQKMVEDNLGLVGKVIRDKVHGLGQAEMMEYDDLFQIGSIGLCKAAATDKGGSAFSTYAYRLIWNEICDALVKQSRIQKREQNREGEQSVAASDVAEQWELREMLSKAETAAEGAAARGIHALKLFTLGYSSQEIADLMQAQPGTVRLWMTKARRFLRANLEMGDV